MVDHDMPHATLASDGRAPLRLYVVSDTICPWCYVGKRLLAAALAELGDEKVGLEIAWVPFQLNPAMPKEGVARQLYRTAKFGSWERSQMLDAQVEEAGRSVGLEFRHDLMARTPNTLASHALVRLAWETGGADLQDRVVEALFAAYFRQGQDIGDTQVLVTLAGREGLGRSRVLDAISSPETLDAVSREDMRMRALGLQGVPALLFDKRHVLSGAQPVTLILRALRQAGATVA